MVSLLYGGKTMPDNNGETKIFSQLGAVRILRYTYGGLLFALLLAIVNTIKATQITEALNPLFTTIVIIITGIGIYVVHRHVLREIVIFPIVHHTYHLFGKILLGVKEPYDYIDFLKKLKIKPGLSRSAYSSIRQCLFTPKTRERLSFLHFELHILWITVEELLFFAFYIRYKNIPKESTFLMFIIIAAIIAVLGLLAEYRQNLDEYHMLMVYHKQGRLESFLKWHGYLDYTSEEEVAVAKETCDCYD